MVTIYSLVIVVAYSVDDIASVTIFPGNVGCRLTILNRCFTDEVPCGHLQMRLSHNVFGNNAPHLCMDGVCVFCSIFSFATFIHPNSRNALIENEEECLLFGREGGQCLLFQHAGNINCME